MIHFDLDDQPVLNENGIGKRFSDEKIQDRKTSTETNFTN